MSTYSKPLPDVADPGTAPFWLATRESKLVAQRCNDCGYLRWPPGPACPECLSPEAEWTPLQPSATLITHCTYHRALAPAFADDIPYVVGYVQLDEGPRMYGLLVGAEAEFTSGQRLEPVFDSVTDDVTLVRWTPVAQAVPSAEQR